MTRIRFGQIIKCARCGRHLASFAMRLKCVFGCGAWLCRRGDCRHEHVPGCPEYLRLDAIASARITNI